MDRTIVRHKIAENNVVWTYEAKISRRNGKENNRTETTENPAKEKIKKKICGPEPSSVDRMRVLGIWGRKDDVDEQRKIEWDNERSSEVRKLVKVKCYISELAEGFNA